tara:strand:- start:3552 stop:4115 length:564 start_codon:yes stop_codon:yes gene_type:complete
MVDVARSNSELTGRYFAETHCHILIIVVAAAQGRFPVFESTVLKTTPHKLIAQFNLAELRHGPNDPRLVGFSAGANMIRRAASIAPGHVWNAQDVIDGSFFATRSVWESVEALHRFVYSGIHRRYLNRTNEWFIESDRVNMVLWGVSSGEIPGLVDAQERLEYMRTNGPSKRAFSFGSAAAFISGGQ